MGTSCFFELLQLNNLKLGVDLEFKREKELQREREDGGRFIHGGFIGCGFAH